MNTRIRLLAEEATTKVEYYPPSCDGHTQYRYDFDKEKFAQLIVAECCVALHPMLRDMISRTQAVDMIVEHFRDKE